MFGKGKKEKDIQKLLEGLTPEEMNDLTEAINAYNESQKGNATNENSSNAQDNASENEKSNEVAPTTDDTTPAENNEQQPNAIPIENVMLKSDFEEYVKQFEEKFSNVQKENEELKNKNSELEKEKEDLKEKYEKGSFGNYTDKSANASQQVKTKETFKEYTDKFFK